MTEAVTVIDLDPSTPESRAALLKARLRDDISRQIKQLRQKRKLTQIQMAQLMGTAQPVISRIESQSGDQLSVSTLISIAKAFDVNLIVKFSKYPVPKITKKGSDLHEA